MVPFSPTIKIELDGEIEHDELLRLLEGEAPDGAAAYAIRVDGEFNLVRARSVPKQDPPYRPLAEVIGEQHEFELRGAGTLVGFRFPDYSEGIEVAGHHLHFITADRERGGHVLDCRLEGGRALIDRSEDLHVELPPGVALDAPDLSASTHAAIERVEHPGRG